MKLENYENNRVAKNRANVQLGAASNSIIPQVFKEK